MTGLIDALPATDILPGVPEGEDIIRAAILAECERRELNAYQLWKLVKDTGVSRATVFNFFRKDEDGKPGTTLNTRHAAQILRALGLSIYKPRKKV